MVTVKSSGVGLFVPTVTKELAGGRIVCSNA